MNERITKEEASRVARQLVSLKNDYINTLKDAYNKKAYELYNATIPKEVHAFHKKYPDYFDTSNSVYVDSFGFNREWLNCPDDKDVIKVNNKSELKLTRETSKDLLQEKRVWEKERDRVEKMRSDIKHALINLHTYKRIIQTFPEAEAYLPKKYQPPAVNYGHLKPVVRELIGSMKEDANKITNP